MRIVTGYEPIGVSDAFREIVDIEGEVTPGEGIGDSPTAIHGSANWWPDPRRWGPREHGHVTPRIGTEVLQGWAEGAVVPSGQRLVVREDPDVIKARWKAQELKAARAELEHWTAVVAELEGE